MATKVDELYVEVTTKADRLDAGLRSTIQKVDAAASRIQVSLTKVDNAFAKLGSGLATSAIVSGIVAITKNAILAADHINDLSKRTGVAVENLSAFAYVAKLSGTDVDAFAGALSKMNKNLGEALTGNKSATEAFTQLGLSLKTLQDLSPEEQFLAIADKINHLGSEAEKTKATMDIFGKSGASLIPIFEGGADAIRTMLTEAREVGAVFSKEEAEKIARFNDAIDKLGMAAEGVARDGFLILYDAVSDVLGIFDQAESKITSLGAAMRGLTTLTSALNPGSAIGRLIGGKIAGGSSGEQYGPPMEQYGPVWKPEAIDKATTSLIRYNNAATKTARAQKDHAVAAKSAFDALMEQLDAEGEAQERLDSENARRDKERADEIARRTKELADEMARQAEESMRPFQHAFENVQDALADMLVQGKFSFESLADIAKRLAAEVAAAWVIKPVMSGAMSSLMGGTSLGGGAGSSLLSGGSNLFSGLTGGFNTPILNPGLAFDIGNSLGLSGSAVGALQGGLANFTPAAGLAGFGGNLLGNLVFGGDRGIGASAGGTLGGIAGTAIGGPIGAALGSFLGNAVGGLFGPGKPHPAAGFGGQIGAGGALDIKFQSKHIGTEMAEALAQQLQGIVAGLTSAGIDLKGTEIHGGTDPGRFGSAGFFGVGGLSNLIKFDPANAESLNNALGRLVIELTKTADVTNDRVKTALQNLQIEGRQAADVLREITDAATFDTRQAGFVAQLEDEILRLSDPLAYQTKQLMAQVDELMKQAVALEVDPALVERWRDLQLAQINGTESLKGMADAAKEAMDAASQAAEQFEAVRSRLQSTLEDTLLGSDSPLSAQAKYDLARGKLAALAGNASVEGLAQVPEAFAAFIEQSRALKASSAGYKDDFSYGQGILEQAIGLAGGQAAAKRAEYTQLAAALSGLGGTGGTAAAPLDTNSIIAALQRLAVAQEQNNALVKGLAAA